jgi:hypothetical protein
VVLMQRPPVPSCLVLWVGVLALSGCATARQPGTPMKTNCPSTIPMPTIEECREAARVIRNEELRVCVSEQCGDISLVCDEETRKRCKEESEAARRDILAYVIRLDSTSTSSRVKEAHWCEEPASFRCILKVVIHELAHSCGWRHGGGEGVPGHEKTGVIPECQCAPLRSGSVVCG